MEQGQQMRQVIFKASFTKDIKQQLLTEFYCSLLQQQTIQKGWDGMGEQHVLTKLLKFIQRISIKNLDLYHNNFPSIINAISLPVYSQLTSLSLRFNTIHNIEALAFMDMQKLQYLNIKDNRIVQVKAINKTRWPCLSTLQLGDNQLNQANLDRVKMSHYIDSLNVRNTCKNISILVQQRVLFIKIEPSHILPDFHNRCKNSSYITIYKAIADRYLTPS